MRLTQLATDRREFILGRTEFIEMVFGYLRDNDVTIQETDEELIHFTFSLSAGESMPRSLNSDNLSRVCVVLESKDILIDEEKVGD